MKRTFPILIAITMTVMVCVAMAAAQQSLGDAAREARAAREALWEKHSLDTVSPGNPAPGDIRPVRVIQRAAPLYPPEAKARRIVGTVDVEAIVGKQGNLVNARVVSGPKIFWDSALSAIKACKFEPARLKEQPVEQTVRLRFEFRGTHPD